MMEGKYDDVIKIFNIQQMNRFSDEDFHRG